MCEHLLHVECFTDENQSSLNAVQLWGQEVGFRAAACEEGSIASHEMEGDALEQLTHSFPLI